MRNKRKLITRIILIIMLSVLVAGITISIVRVCKGNNNKNINEIEDGQPASDEIYEELKSRTVLFSASQNNNSLVGNHEDLYQSYNWTVYYDGSVEYYENYNLSGRTSTVTWELTDNQYERLMELLQGKLLSYDDNYDSACQGDVWHYTYYGFDGTKIHSFNGYNHSASVLLEISEILDSDVREQVELSVVEKSDKHMVMFDATYENYAEDMEEDRVVFTHWTVYYDGVIEMQETYQCSGKQAVMTWELDDYTYGRLVRDIKYYSNDNLDEAPVDGEDYWTMTYYDEAGDEIYTAKAVDARDNVFGNIYSDIKEPGKDFVYVEDPNDNCSTSYTKGDYYITIDSINPGLSNQGDDLFISHIQCKDKEKTTLSLKYRFTKTDFCNMYGVTEGYTLITIGDKNFYYKVSKSDEWWDEAWLYYINPDGGCMIIGLEKKGGYDAQGNWVDETDADLEELLYDEVMEQAIRFEITKN
ncbi:MAG: hypothetical protein J6A59_18845 [Lachnospiraceae bacterium]|nr:hypothetical protein [Lachnospiraceae bacterium]